MTDILRLTVYCDTPDDVMQVVRILADAGSIKVSRVKARLNSFVSDVTFNLVWLEQCCCEL